MNCVHGHAHGGGHDQVWVLGVLGVSVVKERRTWRDAQIKT
jgi:hypothetical protein